MPDQSQPPLPNPKLQNPVGFLFAPGAGAPSSHPWMERWKARLESLGAVVTFDYDYLREGRKRPDRPAQLIAAHRAALAELVDRNSKIENCQSACS